MDKKKYKKDFANPKFWDFLERHKGFFMGWIFTACLIKLFSERFSLNMFFSAIFSFILMVLSFREKRK